MKKVLVIDDEQTTLGLLKHKLSSEEFEVLTAIDGMEGISVAQKEKPDLNLVKVPMLGVEKARKTAVMRIYVNAPITRIPLFETFILEILSIEKKAKTRITRFSTPARIFGNSLTSQ